MIYFSVIIPVYNSKRYIGECITSIMSQTFYYYEVIIIDDGSDDGSSTIINELIANDKRFHYYYQSNQGVSAARNNGLKKVNGKYVIFIDSDDYIDINSFSTFYSFIIKFDPDILMCGTKQIDNKILIDNYSKLSNYFSPDTLYFGEDVYKIMLENKSFVPMVCNNIYKYDIIVSDKIIFQNIIYEDALWIIDLLFNNPKVLIVDFDFYYYRRHKYSITRSSSFDKIYYSVLFIVTKLIAILNRSIDITSYGWLIVHIYIWYLHLWKSLNSTNLYASDWPKVCDYDKLNININHLNNSQLDQLDFLFKSLKLEHEQNKKRFSLSQNFEFNSIILNEYAISNVYVLNKDLDVGIISIYANYFIRIASIFNSSVYIISTTNNINRLNNEMLNDNIHLFDQNANSITTIQDFIISSNSFYLIIHHEITLYPLSVLNNAINYIKSNSNSIAILDFSNILKIKHLKFNCLINYLNDISLFHYINCNYLKFKYNPYIYNSFMIRKKDFNKAFMYIYNSANMYICKFGISLVFSNHLLVKCEVAIFMNIMHTRISLSNTLEKLYMSHPDFNTLKYDIEYLTLSYNKQKYIFYDGIMGYAFFLVVSSKYFNNSNYLNIANDFIDHYVNLIFISPTADILNDLIIVSNSLNYIQYKSLIDVSPNFLNSIDNYYCNYIINGIYSDYSFEHGISGIGTYLVNRVNNLGVRYSHRKKIMITLHILINRLCNYIYDTASDLLPSNKIIIDIYIYLILNNGKGVNKNKSLELSSFILTRYPYLMSNASVYQNIRFSNQINDIQKIMNLSKLQNSSLITENNYSLKGGLLEKHLWRLSEIFEYDLDWWCIY